MIKSQFDITFIVPVYNTERNVFQRCINSITAIDKLKYEIIIIDDGSKEKCARYCDIIACSIKNCKCIHQKNRGVSRARNVGIAKAEGKYLYFVDSDDVIIPEAFYKLLNFEQQLIFTDVVIKVNSCSERWSAFDDGDEEISINEVLCKMAQDGKLNGPYAKLIKTDFIKENNILFREDMVTGEDALFLIDMLTYSPSMYYIKCDSYYYYRQESTGMARLLNQPVKIINNIVTIYKSLLCLIPKSYFWKDVRLDIVASESFIKQIFNIAAELIEFHLCTEYNKKMIEDAVNLVELAFYHDFNFQTKVRYVIIKKQMWRCLKILSYIRRKYLSVKYGKS